MDSDDVMDLDTPSRPLTAMGHRTPLSPYISRDASISDPEHIALSSSPETRLLHTPPTRSPTGPKLQPPSKDSHNLNPLCPICASRASYPCPSGCGRVLYCSYLCAKQDSACHFVICNRAACGKPRPSETHRRGFFFSNKSKMPRVVWLKTTGNGYVEDAISTEGLESVFGEEVETRKLSTITVGENVRRLRRVGGIAGKGGEIMIMWDGGIDGDGGGQDDNASRQRIGEPGEDDEIASARAVSLSANTETRVVGMHDESVPVSPSSEGGEHEDEKNDDSSLDGCDCSDSECGLTQEEVAERYAELDRIEEERKTMRNRAIRDLLSGDVKPPEWYGNLLVFALRPIKDADTSMSSVRDLEIAEFRDVVDILENFGPGKEQAQQGEELVVDVAKLPPGERVEIQMLRCTRAKEFGHRRRHDALARTLPLSNTQFRAIVEKVGTGYEDLTLGKMIGMPLRMYRLMSQTQPALGKKSICHRRRSNVCDALKIVGVLRWHGMNPDQPSMGFWKRSCVGWVLFLQGDGRPLTRPQSDAILSMTRDIAQLFSVAFEYSERKSQETESGNKALIMASESGYVHYFEEMRKKMINGGSVEWLDAKPY